MAPAESFEVARKEITKARNQGTQVFPLPSFLGLSRATHEGRLTRPGSLTCRGLLHEVELMPEVGQVWVFLLHRQGDEMQQGHLPVSGLGVQQLEGGARGGERGPNAMAPQASRPRVAPTVLPDPGSGA